MAGEGGGAGGGYVGEYTADVQGGVVQKVGTGTRASGGLLLLLCRLPYTRTAETDGILRREERGLSRETYEGKYMHTRQHKDRMHHC